MDRQIKGGRTAAQDKYDKENIETVSFKTKKGSRARLKQAAEATGQSTNGFIRANLNKSVKDVIGVPMEYVESDSQEGK
jgi:uncharacterized protein (DUF1778 family)